MELPATFDPLSIVVATVSMAAVRPAPWAMKMQVQQFFSAGVKSLSQICTM